LFGSPIKKSVDFFNPDHLKDHKSVANALQRIGFKKVEIATPDLYLLHGLFLEKPDAQATIILASGFWPGRKEALAPFLFLFPSDYNILFFDARGHGKSDGFLFQNLKSYGLNEYQDIIGAIEFVHYRTDTPIILYGCCAGAFHATHATLKIQEQGNLKKFNLKGLVFDSGWASLQEAVDTVPFAELEKRVSAGLSKFLKIDYEQAKQTRICRAVIGLLSPLLKGIKNFWVAPSFKKNNPRTNLYDKMGSVQIPMFFVHSVDDTFAPFQSVQQLANAVSDRHTWWIPANLSAHARHHFSLPDRYKNYLKEFCTYALQK